MKALIDATGRFVAELMSDHPFSADLTLIDVPRPDFVLGDHCYFVNGIFVDRSVPAVLPPGTPAETVVFK
jgi:hypothetical protein